MWQMELLSQSFTIAAMCSWENTALIHRSHTTYCRVSASSSLASNPSSLLACTWTLKPFKLQIIQAWVMKLLCWCSEVPCLHRARQKVTGGHFDQYSQIKYCIVDTSIYGHIQLSHLFLWPPDVSVCRPSGDPAWWSPQSSTGEGSKCVCTTVFPFSFMSLLLVFVLPTVVA